MAIYSLSTKPMSRSGGRSAVAAAAYRSGTELADERTGLVSDYTRRHGVVHTEIVAPEGISGVDREQLWNAAEAAEKRKDARVAREYLVALPHELDADQRLALTRELASELVERYGVAVDVAIHAPDRDGDERNHHAHLLATTRRLNHDGLGEKAAIEWSDKKRKAAGLDRGADEVKMLRQRWETLANAALERAQVAERVDCRSLKDQGVDRVPQIHVGPMGTEQMRRGRPEASARAVLNLEIKAVNQERHQLQERAAQEQEERQAAQRQQQVIAKAQQDPAGTVALYRKAWQHERTKVTAQAERLRRTAQEQRREALQRLVAHRADEPAPPRGLAKLWRQKQHDAEHDAWKARESAQQRRVASLERRSAWLSGMSNETQQHGLEASPGDRLTAQRVERRFPELVEAESVARPILEQQRQQERERRRQERQQEREAKRRERLQRQSERMDRSAQRRSAAFEAQLGAKPQADQEKPQTPAQERMQRWRAKQHRDRGRGGPER